MHYGFQLFQGGIKTQTVDFFTGHVHPRGLKKTAHLNIDRAQGGGRKVCCPQTILTPADRKALASMYCLWVIEVCRACCQGRNSRKFNAI
jgi:hypothetical protein